MPSSAEVMTLLAVVEAQDMATSIISRIADVFKGLAGTVEAAAGSSEAAMGRLDAAFLAGDISAKNYGAVQDYLAKAEADAALATNELASAQGRLNAALLSGNAEQLTVAMQGVRDAETAAEVSTVRLTEAQARMADANLISRNNATIAGEAFATMGKAATVGSVALLGTAAASVKMAGDFQSQTTTLVTGAGVSAEAIDGVRKFLLDPSVQSGTSTKALTDGFFAVNSRTGDVTKSMQIMTSATEMAQVHHADLATTV